MTSWTLILRSLRFHARAHLGVVLGATVGSAALVGALVVGDSVRESLRELALLRLGKTEFALSANDWFFRAKLADDIAASGIAPVLQLPGTAASINGAARANRVQVLGVDNRFWALAGQPPAFGAIPKDAVVLNSTLAEQLKARVGDTVLLRLEKPSLLSRDVPISPQDDYAVATRLKVHAIVSDAEFGRFSLQANQVPPFNAFVPIETLQENVNLLGRANMLLAGQTSNQASAAGGLSGLSSALRSKWQLADAELELRDLPAANCLELRTSRIFIDPPVAEAARKAATNAQPILTYFVNELRDGPRAAPYSMVTAMGAPVVPADMRDDEILVNDWLADDLQTKPGDKLSLTYYVISADRKLVEQQSEFRVHGGVPMAGAAADPALMPDFPGIAKAESSHDWDAGFPIQLNQIRDKDEKYWKEHRGTPKAFITLAAGQKIWSNRFGDFTAIRFPQPGATAEAIEKTILQTLDPAAVGLGFQPVRGQALAASAQSQDFGGLFIGFSFFLIVAALLLMALLFQFGLEQRTAEIGTLLALGFGPRQVRRMLLLEGSALALVGGILGAFGGVFYARAMLHGLTTVWRGAVGTSALHFHVLPGTLAGGAFAGAIVAALAIWLTLRRQAQRPARELLAAGAELKFQISNFKSRRRSFGGWIASVSAVIALAMVGGAVWKHDTSSSETFFGAGALLLIAGLGFSAAWLAALGRQAVSTHLTVGGLGLRSSARRRKRSLATIGLLACGCFLIVAVGAFRLEANADAAKRSSGSGGFALIGESTLPVSHDLNARAGRDFYGLNAADLAGVDMVSFRVRDGDDASCLNLNRAQKPRVLGVNPEALQSRQAFTFAEVAKGMSGEKPWLLLKNNHDQASLSRDEVPAIADENSILWALGKKVGDTIDYTDERGKPFKLRLVAALANSVLQGSLIIDEAEFVKRFPGESGYRMFLIDAPSNQVSAVSAALSRALQDVGMELTPAAKRLNAYNAVQNTYLSTFQVLGGLGLLLGSAGLGIVVLRNVQERRGELALLLAVGFRKSALQWLVLTEHGALLGLGLGVGLAAAVIGVLPALLSPGSQIPYLSLALTLAAVVMNGLIWTWLATRFALRGKLIEALRNE